VAPEFRFGVEAGSPRVAFVVGVVFHA
jgi:hypothetical protein